MTILTRSGSTSTLLEEVEAHLERAGVPIEVGPVLRVGARAFFAAQRAFEKRGRYAAPWALLSRVYGPGVLASAEATGAVSAAR